MKKVLDVLASVEGWLSAPGADLLYRLAKEARGGAIVEIGSWKGRSTIILALGSLAGASLPVFAIDPHTGSLEHGSVWTYPEFIANLERWKVTTLVHPILKRSDDVDVNEIGPIACLWIDGAHDEQSVRSDFERWWPLLIDGGTIAFHDSSWPGVRTVIWEKLFPSREVGLIRRCAECTFVTKRSHRLLSCYWPNQVHLLIWKAERRWIRWKRRHRKKKCSE